MSRTNKDASDTKKDPNGTQARVDKTKVQTDEGRKGKETETKIEDEEEKRKNTQKNFVAFVVSFYTVIVLSFGIYSLTSIWPATPAELTSNATTTVVLRGTGISFSLGPETLVIVVMIIAGAIGACVFSLSTIAHHLAKKTFGVEWQAWYFLRPFTGSGLAMIFYFLVRGGLLTLGANLQNLNLIVIAGLSGLIGMFSEQALRKLRGLADTTFGAAPGGKTKPEEPTPPGENEEETQKPPQE